MGRAAITVSLLAGLWACAGCSERQVVVTVAGHAAGLHSLHAVLTLGGVESRPIAEFPGNATELGLSLPPQPTGPLVLELDGLAANRCSVARGAADLSGVMGTATVTVTLQPLPAPSCCNAAGFCWDNPLPTGAELRRVWGASDKDLWIAGEGGALWHYDGQTLSPVSLGSTLTLLALSGSGPRDIWAGASDGSLFYYDGARWTMRQSGTPGPINALWAIAQNDVWAATSDTLLHWDGNAWTRLEMGGLLGLWASGPHDLWGVGNGGVVLHYDGATFATQTPLAGRRLSAVWGSGPQDVWAAGQGGARLHYDGTAWTVTDMTGPTWYAAWGTGAGDVWLVGDGASAHYEGGAWTAVPIGPAATLYGVWGDASGPVAVGSVGTVRRWAGGIWSAVAPVQGPAQGALGPALDLRAVGGAAPDNLWAVGGSGPAQGFIAHYDGAAWSHAQDAPGRLHDLALRGTTAWAVGDGGTLLRYQGGMWAALDSTVGVSLRSVWAAPAGDFWVAGDGGTLLHGVGDAVHAVASGTLADLHAVWGSGASDIWVVGANGTVLHGAGSAFTAQSGLDDLTKGATLRAIWGSAAGQFWIAGDKGLILRHGSDGWSAGLSGATEDLLRLWGAGPSDVWCAGGNDLPGQRVSALLHWNGQRWDRVPTGTDRLSLHGLFGTGRPGRPGRVWAVGESGAVLRQRTF